jgi:hypothetical protein
MEYLALAIVLLIAIGLIWLLTKAQAQDRSTAGDDSGPVDGG